MKNYIIEQSNNVAECFCMKISAKTQRISKLDVTILGIVRPVLGPDSGLVPCLR